MAKTTITEDDLLAGVGGLGSFGNLGAGKPIRDNPFRGTKQAEPVTQVQPIVTQEKAKAPVAPPVQVADPVAPLVVAQPARPKVEIVPKVQAKAAEPVAEPKRTKKERKSDLYVEKVSTFLSTEMRDSLTTTARKLNSNRLVKGDPITMHTLLRCGVRVVTELLEFSTSDVISSEEELQALIAKKLKAGLRSGQ